MANNKLEQRMEELEAEVFALRKRVESMASSQPWWERIAGSFQNDPIYERAMKLGRKYRRAQRPSGT